ncbi:MAG: DUF1028 domain-containing protein [Bacteroidota bacterium]
MKIRIIILLLLTFSNFLTEAQNSNSSPLASTYSIVARDSITGEMGIAVQSHAFSVGSIVGWGEAGIGVVATQSFVNRAYGLEGLRLLKAGKTPADVIKILTDADSARDVRQLAALDMQGRTASYTGKKCIPAAGNISGKNFSVQANLMLNETVCPAMAKAFEETKGPLAERMIAALEAAQNEGGDIRGMQSASLLIVNPVATGRIWEDKPIDLRVEDNVQPIVELKRLLNLYRAYEHSNLGDLAVEKNDLTLAEKEYGIAEKMLPADSEMKFWHAVSLVNKGKTEDALPLFKKVFAMDTNWKILIPRLRKVELLICNDETEMKILNLK